MVIGTDQLFSRGSQSVDTVYRAGNRATLVHTTEFFLFVALAVDHRICGALPMVLLAQTPREKSVYLNHTFIFIVVCRFLYFQLAVYCASLPHALGSGRQPIFTYICLDRRLYPAADFNNLHDLRL